MSLYSNTPDACMINVWNTQQHKYQKATTLIQTEWELGGLTKHPNKERAYVPKMKDRDQCIKVSIIQGVHCRYPNYTVTAPNGVLTCLKFILRKHIKITGSPTILISWTSTIHLISGNILLSLSPFFKIWHAIASYYGLIYMVPL